MAVKDIPGYKDIRGSIRRDGRYPYVGTAVKDTHVIHHSMTPMYAGGSTPQAFANHHIDANGWHGCAYVFVIMPDGTFYQTDDYNRRLYHVGNYNTRSIGTCVVGDFRTEGANEKPTKAQMRTLYLINKELYKELPNMKRTIGHQEAPGYSWKNCPGNTWDYEKVIAGEFLVVTEGGKPTATPGSYRIQEGDTFWSIAKGIPGVSMDDIVKANSNVDPGKLQIGQLIKIPGTKTNESKPAAKPSPSYVGKRVEAKTDLRFYFKPSWRDKDVAGTMRKGEGFIILDKLNVDGAQQYKVRNSKNHVYYLTASSKYVDVDGAVSTPTKPKPVTSNGIKIIDYIKIVGVNTAAIVMDDPDRVKAREIGTIPKGTTVPIAGSTKGRNNPDNGYWEIIYKGERAYISGQYGRR
jgi:N-acetylmuramoyl-L-alanine amidase/LysM domain